jgi:hypothetical protein
MKKFVEIFGWYGAVAILAAYAGVTFGVLSSNGGGGILFQFLNLTGALGLVVVSFYKKTYQPGVLNLVWTLVALVALIRIFLSR